MTDRSRGEAMSNPSPSQVREAIDGYTTAISRDEMSRHLVTVLDAAAFFTDRYRDCDECGGTGDGCASGGQHENAHVPCPSCLGGGAVPTDESVEVVAAAIIKVAGTGTGEEGYMRVYVDQHAMETARAALIALYMMESP